MDRLKAILADKILDLSSGSGDEVKSKIDKMQRFRDFANACQTLMLKYPRIEEELIKMVNDGDFDTKVASSRVDSVIRLADAEVSQTNRMATEIAQVEFLGEEGLGNLVIDGAELPKMAAIESSELLGARMQDDVVIEAIESEQEPVLLPEDIDYEELQVTPEEESQKGYISYENVVSADTNPSSEQKEDISQNRNLSEDEIAAIKQKATIRRVVQIVGAILAVVALIFIIKFVMSNWQTILIIVGIAALVAVSIVWFKRKRG